MQITQTVRLRWKSIVPILGIIGVWLGGPEVANIVGPRWAAVLLAVSGLIAALTPALLTNRPKTAKRPKKAPVPNNAPNDASPDFTRGE